MWFKRHRRKPDEPPTDTVGNPIIRRNTSGTPGDGATHAPRHAAPEGGLTRAERRMLEFVAARRVERTTTGAARSSFWRVDRGFAIDTKATMLDWLRSEGYIEIGGRSGVKSEVVLTEAGRRVLDEGAG